MPLGFGSAVFTTSDPGAGTHYTRFRGPLLVGTPYNENAGATNTIQAPHVVNVSTARADMLASVVSSWATGNATSSSFNVSTGLPTGLVYITMATGAGNLVHAASTANAPVGLPGGLNGVAICWDAAKKTLAVYEPNVAGWMWPHAITLDGVITWSASSS